jgi:ClpP class serine protease
MVLKIRSPDIGPGKVRELRAAIQQVRAAGKRVTAQLESATASDYLVACACDEIVMPESGEIMIPGIRAEVMYFKGLFDLVGIQPDMLQIGDFKGAAEPYMRKEMSPEFRRQYESLLDDDVRRPASPAAAETTAGRQGGRYRELRQEKGEYGLFGNSGDARAVQLDDGRQRVGSTELE